MNRLPAPLQVPPGAQRLFWCRDERLAGAKGHYRADSPEAAADALAGLRPGGTVYCVLAERREPGAWLAVQEVGAAGLGRKEHFRLESRA